MVIKKHDFIQLDYITKIKTTNKVIDTSIEKIGKENKLNKTSYNPQIICIGEGLFMIEVENNLIGKPLKPIIIDLTPEKAFGLRDSSKIKIIPIPKFTKEKINPYPGLVVDVDGRLGIIKSVNGGRVRVDFNHQLAGKELTYELTNLKKIDKTEDKLSSLLSQYLGIPDTLIIIDFKDETAIITLPKPPLDLLLKEIENKVKSLIPEVKKTEFKDKQLLKNN